MNRKIRKVIKMFKKARHNDISIVLNGEVYDITITTSFGSLELAMAKSALKNLSVFQIFQEINMYYTAYIGLSRLQKEDPKAFDEIMSHYNKEVNMYYNAYIGLSRLRKEDPKAFDEIMSHYNKEVK